MTRRTALRPVLVAVTAAALAAVPVASAAPPPVPSLVVSGPQGATIGFATPTVPTVQGQSVELLNADTVGHSVVSRATKPKRVKFGKRFYTIQVPLFASKDVAPAATGVVSGVTALKPGTYDFYCAAHTGMTGQLVVNAG